MLTLGIGLGIAAPCVAAQHPRAQYPEQNGPKPAHPPRAQNPQPQRPPAHPQQQPRIESRPSNGNHSTYRTQPQQPQNNARPPGNGPSHPPPSPNYALPPGNALEGGRGVGNERVTPRQQLGVGTPRPWVDQMRTLPPQQRERVLQNSQAFQRMPAEQQTKIRQQFNQWDKMSPQQRTDQQSREETWRAQ